MYYRYDVFCFQAISKFALNHDETVARRLLMSKKNVDEVSSRRLYRVTWLVLRISFPDHKRRFESTLGSKLNQFFF